MLAMIEREFLVCSVVQSLGQVRGRKRFQKMMYIAKSLGYPVPEDFVWGNYGVYSSELQWELDGLVKDGIIVEENVSPEGLDPEYAYRLAPKGASVLEQAAILAAVKEGIPGFHSHEDDDPVLILGNNELDAMISFLRLMSEKTVSDLELWSSILYLNQSEKNEENLVAFLRYLKPKYTEAEIRDGIKEVHSLQNNSLENARREETGRKQEQ
jgi:uncharacterized protein YwgA